MSVVSSYAQQCTLLPNQNLLFILKIHSTTTYIFWKIQIFVALYFLCLSTSIILCKKKYSHRVHICLYSIVGSVYPKLLFRTNKNPELYVVSGSRIHQQIVSSLQFLPMPLLFIKVQKDSCETINFYLMVGKTKRLFQHLVHLLWSM